LITLIAVTSVFVVHIDSSIALPFTSIVADWQKMGCCYFYGYRV